MKNDDHHDTSVMVKKNQLSAGYDEEGAYSVYKATGWLVEGGVALGSCQQRMEVDEARDSVFQQGRGQVYNSLAGEGAAHAH